MADPDNIDLAYEIEELLKTIIAFSHVLENQQVQIEGMLKLFDMILNDPPSFFIQKESVKAMIEKIRNPPLGDET